MALHPISRRHGFGGWLDRIDERAPGFIDVYKAAAVVVGVPLVMAGFLASSVKGVLGPIGIVLVVAGFGSMFVVLRRYHPHYRDRL